MSQDDEDNSGATAEIGSLFVESLASVASFLSLADILSCRLASMESLNLIHSALTVEDCADRLGHLLQNREAVVLGSTRRWKDAGNDTFQVLQCLRQLDTVATNPLDAVLRIMRILKHLPEQLAVLYTGKYGRFCAPCHAESGTLQVDAYPPCPKGKKNCESCAFRIPPRALLLDVAGKQDEEGPMRNAAHNREGGGGDDDEESSDESTEEKPPDIYSILSIKARHRNRARGVYSMDLENFYCKCVPNLPHDLICPLCRVSNRRTLLLSAFSYQSEPSSAREQPGHMSLSFTPLVESETKRARHEERADNHDDNTTTDHFPPKEYVDMFLPSYSAHLLLRALFRQDCKHAMAIHCTSCQKFGLIAPARLCMPCLLRLEGADQSVGGVVFRPSRTEESFRMHCRWCSQANQETDSEQEEKEGSEAESADNSRDAAESEHHNNAREDYDYGDNGGYEGGDGDYGEYDQASDVEHAYGDYGNDDEYGNDGDYY